jgi:hypothetical protein
MKTNNTHMISNSNWRRISHLESGILNCEGGTEV